MRSDFYRNQSESICTMPTVKWPIRVLSQDLGKPEQD